jgi:predicted phosphodiesterase
MSGLTWLHLSDWHQGGNEFDRQVVLSALLKDIRERAKISPNLENINFVIFSGDVAFGGKSDQYKAAKKQLFQPLMGACGLEPDQLFIVPGNHDLDMDEFRFLPSDLQRPLTSEAEVQNWLTDGRGRSKLLEPFTTFADFVKNYTGQELPDYGNVRRWQIADKKIAALGLNSAWMCGRSKSADGKISDKGFVLVGEPQIHDILEEISDADIKIAVIHHPFDWLAEFDSNRIEFRLKQSCDFILRGHQHKPMVEITGGTSGDCVIVPAGASYDRRMAENPRYVNSYNFVHLDFNTGKGIVFLRRWSDPRNKWVEDNDSCAQGRFEFSLPEAAHGTSTFPGIAGIKSKPTDYVFICYVREDEDFVLKLATNLKNLGISVWLDQWDIPSGADWDLAIDDALYGCSSFLIVLSPLSIKSDEVRSEFRVAIDEKNSLSHSFTSHVTFRVV